MSVQRLKVVDSHTAGEPTRLVIDGGPDLGRGSLARRRVRFEEQFDHFRSGIVNEPRGSDIVVGAMLCEPEDTSCAAGVIFFNNTGYLGMCGHGTIGLVVTLAHLGIIGIGTHRIETPVGIVTAKLLDAARVTVSNVRSYRLTSGVRVDVPGYGEVHGDVAWGGNWFFLCEARNLALSTDNTAALTTFAHEVRRALKAAGVRGAQGAEIDHIHVFGPASRPELNSRSFVLCPGLAYDRSPCGTGTSAKLACLAADGKLRPEALWRQESVIGTTFDASYTADGDPRVGILPHITGAAHVTSEATLIFDDTDPLRWGVPHHA